MRLSTRIPPTLLVARESLRALAQGLLLLPRALAYRTQREQHRARLRAALAQPSSSFPKLSLPPLPQRPLRLFVSAAERSGEIHAVNLVRELQRLCAAEGAPAPQFAGLGGRALEEAGVRLLGRPVERAQMGLGGVSASLGYWLALVRDCAREWQAQPYDLFIPVDSPALHVPLARIAHSAGLRVVHLVAPQYWGWAPWRAHSYAKAVDRALTILPFEPAWYAQAGVPHAHIGHPLLDELAAIPHSRPPANAQGWVALPGSRASVIERNLPWMLERWRAVQPVLAAPPLVIVVADAAAQAQAQRIVEQSGAQALARVRCGGLHEELAQARCALSVSGTILTDVLHHRLPCVVIYRLGSAREARLSEQFLTVPWFASVNLLADSQVLPEFGFHGSGPAAAVEAAMLRLHQDSSWRTQMIAGMDLAAQRLGPSGAIERAARWVLNEAVGAGRPISASEVNSLE